MLHNQIREARIKAGLSQMQLARLAGIQRSLVQNLENGRNVTIGTLRKVVRHLPNLDVLDAGPFKIVTSRTAEVRDGVRQMLAAGQRLLAILDEARMQEVQVDVDGDGDLASDEEPDAEEIADRE